ncbi:MAG: DUF4153 domain-containing protein [Acidaminobacter sp.]|uniref:DUF4153 domain-containing protein n=1 Tax=Acidaminobacter sp. TaxID=1872102 RepID=UPI0013856EBA|nr:DUF4153 domain-containing protein [Acidaminobacter sp.]MZQ97405.1 DUF4153 domain-containing protein [Acidaminobacter sp.]
MKEIKGTLVRRLQGLIKAAERFPVSVAGFAAALLVVYAIIGEDLDPPLIMQKMVFTLVIGAVLGIAIQFTVESFDGLSSRRVAAYVAGLLLTLGYFLILLPVSEISDAVVIRSLVTGFALICVVLWLPSAGGREDFNRVALTYVKTFATSWLYAAVLSAGFAAVIATVDILLFEVSDEAYAYSMATVWILFAPVYFLSLLPRFDHRQNALENGSGADRSGGAGAFDYPRYLEILVSYIAVPLVAVYTAVLAAYLGKILVTQVWPSGQLGPMVLLYSAAGLLIFVMASLLDNGFAKAYTRVFPKVLIPVVILQLISVGIRLEAYGVTESRYYVALFGVFSLAAGLMLSFSPVSKNGRVALLAAVFALGSILPPVDAFTVSRNSQIGRLEGLLAAEGMLVNGELVAKAEASELTKTETTSIVNYLQGSGGLDYVEWLPEDFKAYEDFARTFGFERTFEPAGGQRYAMVTLDPGVPMAVDGFDRLLSFEVARYEKEMEPQSQRIELAGETYEVKVTRTTPEDTVVKLVTPVGDEVLAIALEDAVNSIAPEMGAFKELMLPEAMTVAVENDQFRMSVVFRGIHLYEMGQGEIASDYSFYVLVGDK